MHTAGSGSSFGSGSGSGSTLGGKKATGTDSPCSCVQLDLQPCPVQTQNVAMLDLAGPTCRKSSFRKNQRTKESESSGWRIT